MQPFASCPFHESSLLLLCGCCHSCTANPFSGQLRRIGASFCTRKLSLSHRYTTHTYTHTHTHAHTHTHKRKNTFSNINHAILLSSTLTVKVALVDDVLGEDAEDGNVDEDAEAEQRPGGEECLREKGMVVGLRCCERVS